MNGRDDRGPRPTEREEIAQAVAQGDGSGIRIAVLDSGVDFAHPLLTRLTPSDDLAVSERGGNLEIEPNLHADCYGHGTAVAGLIHQVAPNAGVGSYRVLGKDLSATSHAVRLAAMAAIRSGYHILNVSLGCPRREMVLIYKDWLDHAWLRGVHVVAASNNVHYRKVEWPAHFSSVLTTSCGPEDEPHRLGFRSDTLVEFSIGGVSERVLWLNGETRLQTGSSYSAARLTGLLARLLSRMPHLDVLSAKSALRLLAQSPSFQIFQEI